MGDMGSTVLMLALMGAAFYFLLIRPQQKRAKKQTEMTNALAAGTRVMLSSGIMGTVRHLGERQAIIEIAPGLEMTVIKQAVVKTLTAEDDEFEYSDDSAEPDDLTDDGPNPFDTLEPSDFNDPTPGSSRVADPSGATEASHDDSYSSGDDAYDSTTDAYDPTKDAHDPTRDAYDSTRGVHGDDPTGPPQNNQK